ncbi:MAG: FHA domain-containing protein [Tannerellaceae bacterium]|jgi:hypothetical protein|nr:FHA domain-containing protein [Tannerellaceae bacterium]
MAGQQYTIGRDEDCNICIEDSSQRISRRHATIKVTGRGRIFVTDHSSNGTFVNGMRIASDVDFPVKRKDVISFANEIDLDWRFIPRRRNKLVIYALAAVALIIVCLLVFYLWRSGAFTGILPCRDAAPYSRDSVDVKTDTLRLETADLPEFYLPARVG